MNNFENGAQNQVSSNSSGGLKQNHQNAQNNGNNVGPGQTKMGPGMSGQIPQGQAPNGGIKYIQNQVKIDQQENKYSLTLNVRNFNNSFNNIKINNIQSNNEGGGVDNMQPNSSQVPQNQNPGQPQPNSNGQQQAQNLKRSNAQFTQSNQNKSARYSRDNSFNKNMPEANASQQNPQLQQYLIQNNNFGISPSRQLPQGRNTTTQQMPKNISQSSEIQSQSSSRPNISFKNIQGVSAGQGSAMQSKSQNYLGTSTIQTKGNSQTRNTNMQQIRSSPGGSALINPTAAQRKSLAMGVNAGPQRQSSYGPHPSNGSAHYKQKDSREFQKSPVTMGNNNINTKRSSNSAIHMGASASKNSSGGAAQANGTASNFIVNSGNIRSNSRTSAGGHSSSNISDGGGRNTSGNVGVVSSKLSEQQSIINKYVEKEKRYVDKIKQLKAENKKLVQLLKDSEKLFYQKLQESKQQSGSLSLLIKQLWPIIKTKVKDPFLLMNTINQCVQSQAQKGQNPIAPLIQDIELLSKDQQKQQKSRSDEPYDPSTNSNHQDIIKKHHEEIQSLQQAFQEQMIKMDNQYNRTMESKQQELLGMQKALVQQVSCQESVQTSMNIGSSLIRAMDFSLEIDDDDLIPAEELRNKIQRSGSKNKISSARVGTISNLFENARKSNPGLFAQDQSKLLQFSQQHKGRNQRQSTEVLGDGKQGQTLSYSKSASNIKVADQKSLGTRGGTIPSTMNQSSSGFPGKNKTQVLNNFVGGSTEGSLQLSQKRGLNKVQAAYADQPGGVQPRSKSSSGMTDQQTVGVKNTFSFGFR